MHIECWSDYLHLILFSWWIQSDSCSEWAWQYSTIRLGLSDYRKHWENSETQNNFRFKETSGRHPAQPSAQSKASFNFRFDCPVYSLVKFCQNSIMKILQSLWALLRYFEIIMENYFLFNPDDNQLGFEIPALYWGWWASQFLSYHVVHTYNPCLLGLTDSVRNHNKSLAMVYNFHCSCLVCKTKSPIPLQKTGVSGIICPCYTDRCPWSVHHVPRDGFSKDITFHGIKVRLFGLLSFLPLLKMGGTRTFFE